MALLKPSICEYQAHPSSPIEERLGVEHHFQQLIFLLQTTHSKWVRWVRTSYCERTGTSEQDWELTFWSPRPSQEVQWAAFSREPWVPLGPAWNLSCTWSGRWASRPGILWWWASFSCQLIDWYLVSLPCLCLPQRHIIFLLVYGELPTFTSFQVRNVTLWPKDNKNSLSQRGQHGQSGPEAEVPLFFFFF